MKSKQTGTLLGVGVGPGDPSLITVGALRALEQADLIVWVKSEGRKSRAQAVIEQHIKLDESQTMQITMDTDAAAKKSQWMPHAQAINEELARGLTVAFVTLGDPMLWSSFTRILEFIDTASCEVKVIPGISAAQHLIANAKITLDRGLTITSAAEFLASVEDFGDNSNLKSASTVIYKVGHRLGAIKEAIAKLNIEGALIAQNLGLSDETLVPLQDCLDARAEYFSCVYVPPSNASASIRGRK